MYVWNDSWAKDDEFYYRAMAHVLACPVNFNLIAFELRIFFLFWHRCVP